MCRDPKEYCKRQRRSYKHGKQQETWSEAELNALEFRYMYYFAVLETLPPTQMRAFLDECRRICEEVEAKSLLQRLVLKLAREHGLVFISILSVLDIHCYHSSVS